MNHQSQCGYILKHFLCSKNSFVIIPELNLLPSISDKIEISRIILTEVNRDTSEISRSRMKVYGYFIQSVRYQILSYQPCVAEHCSRLVPWEKIHGTVNPGKVLFQSGVHHIVSSLIEQVVRVGEVGKLSAVYFGFRLRFLIDNSERNHYVCSLTEGVFHACLILFGYLLHKITLLRQSDSPCNFCSVSGDRPHLPSRVQPFGYHSTF